MDEERMHAVLDKYGAPLAGMRVEARLSFIGRNGLTPLGAAVCAGNWDDAALLLRAVPRTSAVWVWQLTRGGHPALDCALASPGNETFAAEILRLAPDPDALLDEVGQDTWRTVWSSDARMARVVLRGSHDPVKTAKRRIDGGRTPLHVASADVAKELFAAVRPDQLLYMRDGSPQRTTPLHVACMEGRVAVAKAMLDAATDPLKLARVRFKDQHGSNTALFVAIMRLREHIVRLFIDPKLVRAFEDANKHGGTAFMQMCSQVRGNMVRDVLRAHPDPVALARKRDVTRRDALSFAFIYTNTEAFVALLPYARTDLPFGHLGLPGNRRLRDLADSAHRRTKWASLDLPLSDDLRRTVALLL